ncbi:ribonuclease HII [Enterococcus mediterraneensis]|uniref:ribonuclease HII n=1 Tax=Enterococcus mediterraneensis TaxID=2364791 RepID=UPI000F04B8CD|nr:ribonuclease HII [Enterococcus mediterraneensis]
MKPESIQEIKLKLNQIETAGDPYLEVLAKDSRIGVQKLLLQFEKRMAKKAGLMEKYREMSRFEQELYAQGHRFIAGIDEVGRGPLAGPVVAAAVILPENAQILGLNDSKQLSQQKRGELFQQIQQQAVAIGVGVVDHVDIDVMNIYQASRKAMSLAVADLSVQPSHLLIDAMTLDLPIQQQKIIKGDARSISIAAASIIAKEHRDQLMTEYHKVYPYYGFDRNAGYGTKEHLEGLEKYGPTPIHRKTFAPVKKYI